MKIKFDEKTKEEKSILFKFLVKLTGGNVKSFEGNVSKDGLPIGMCTVFMNNGKKQTDINKIDFNINNEYSLEGPAIVTFNDKECVSYNFISNNFGNIDYPTGASYIGDIDKFRRHGQGSYTTRTGLLIEGTFENNKAIGKVTLVFSDGQKATANYINGKPCGNIVKKIGNNSIVNVLFNNGEPISVKYFIDNNNIFIKMNKFESDYFYNINGDCQTYSNGVLTYSGGVKDGAPNGKGTLYTEKGTFVGNFVDGKKEGYGTIYDNNGNIVKQGYYKDDKWVGLKDTSIQLVASQDIPNLNINSIEDITKLKLAVKNFENSIVGQKNAINQIANSLIISFLCEKDTSKPLNSILMTGPTGVGKTETAKQISRHLFGKEPCVIDFGNFKGEHMISSLIGAPSGYKGYDDVPEFLKFLEKNKETGGVILFDELDKADEGCYSVFMRMLDEGEIISAKNEVFKVNNFIIIGTTNFTANNNKILGFTQTKNQDVKDDLVKNNAGLKKEQVARYNIVVEYEELSKENRKEICKKEMQNIVSKVKNINCYNIEFYINDDVVDSIVSNSNASFGARDIKNKTGNVLTTKLAEFIRNNDETNLIVTINSLDDIVISSIEKTTTKEIIKNNEYNRKKENKQEKEM